MRPSYVTHREDEVLKDDTTARPTSDVSGDLEPDASSVRSGTFLRDYLRRHRVAADTDGRPTDEPSGGLHLKDN
ncbi:MAG: hypothetical protein AAFP84_11135 [Actinomycetota bacterium]